MNSRRASVTALAAAALLIPTVAQAATTDYYTAPKIKTRGTSATPIAGAGTVVVKVFVTKAAVAKNFTILRSSNHGDDATALEIAKNSTYVAAIHGKTKQDAFYDFTLKFTSTGVAAATDPSGATGVAKYKAMILAGNYSGAQAGLKTYIAANPTDPAAQLELGIANDYLGDPLAAVAAFGKAGTIPSNDDAVVAHAYTDAATASFKTKDYTSAVDYSKKAVAIAPGPSAYNSLGTAEASAGQNDAAIADLETARKLAAADPAFKPEQKATIDGNLVSAYVNAGKIDQAKVVSAEAAKLDPTSQKTQTYLAQYYVRQASDAQMKQNYALSGDLFEQAAQVAGSSDQPNLYAEAALGYLKAKDSASSAKAKTDADKALAIAPDNSLANLAEGYTLATQGSGKYKDALVYLNKADASAKTANDTALVSTIESLIKQISEAK